MDKKIIKHFQLYDPVLFQVIKKDIDYSKRILSTNNYFPDLCEQIISQQLSGKVAKVIYLRFISIFPNEKVLPELLLSKDNEEFRRVGLSQSKINYIKNLSENVLSGDINLNSLINLNDEEVIKQLTKIKGIGRWTAEMFLIFTLGRKNIFSYGDYGLITAIKKLYGIEKPTKENLEKIVNNWSPYKTYASLILWESLKNR